MSDTMQKSGGVYYADGFNQYPSASKLTDSWYSNMAISSIEAELKSLGHGGRKSLQINKPSDQFMMSHDFYGINLDEVGVSFVANLSRASGDANTIFMAIGCKEELAAYKENPGVSSTAANFPTIYLRVNSYAQITAYHQVKTATYANQMFLGVTSQSYTPGTAVSISLVVTNTGTAGIKRFRLFFAGNPVAAIDTTYNHNRISGLYESGFSYIRLTQGLNEGYVNFSDVVVFDPAIISDGSGMSVDFLPAANSLVNLPVNDETFDTFGDASFTTYDMADVPAGGDVVAAWGIARVKPAEAPRAYQPKFKILGVEKVFPLTGNENFEEYRWPLESVPTRSQLNAATFGARTIP